MSSPTDIASAIGTWATVAVALVALGGIAGPILVWRASRTARNIAISALDAGTAENGGFVSKGIRFSPHIRLLRRVHAPALSNHPKFKESTIKWQSDAPLPSRDSASWVQLGAALAAFGLKYSTGDVIPVNDGRATLPVPKIWLLMFGLLGRFGRRADKGRWPREASRGLISEPASVGQAAGWAVGIVEGMNEDWDDDPGGRSIFPTRYGTTQLWDLVGSLSFSPGANVEFKAHEKPHVGVLSSEPLQPDGLFWLAVGCIPMRDGRVLSLENVQFLGISDPDREEYDPDEAPDMHLPHHPHVQFDDYDPPPPRPPTLPHVPHALYVHPDEGRAGLMGSTTPLGPRKFRFAATDERVESLAGIAEALGADTQDTKALTLHELIPTEVEVPLLAKDAGRTYVPSERDWMRLGSSKGFKGPSWYWFLVRSDAQLLARALLQLPLCAHGHLISRPSDSACREFLIGAAPALPRLLTNTIMNLDLFDVDDRYKDDFATSMRRLLHYIKGDKSKRTLASALYDVDTILGKLIPESDNISMILQILTLTNAESRENIGQSVRRFEECRRATITVDTVGSMVRMLAFFGVVQQFPFDMDSIVDEQLPLDQRLEVEVPYSHLLLIVLKATVRSAVLMTSLDSFPLLEQVSNLPDVVNMC
jgi:hypothetical protein